MNEKAFDRCYEIKKTDVSIGFAITGSFCTHAIALVELEKLVKEYKSVVPILSEASCSTDTRFGTAKQLIEKVESITNNKIINTISGAEPLGPKKMIDALVIAPCTSNTLAKIRYGITDTSVSMAVKSSLRNGNPLLIGISTNDGLGNSAKNIGELLNIRNIYFVPFKQDDYINKPRSLVAKFELLGPALWEAITNKEQFQPIIAL